MKLLKLVLVFSLLMIPGSSLYASCGSCGDDAKSDCSSCESQDSCGSACGPEQKAVEPAKTEAATSAKTEAPVAQTSGEPSKVEEKGHENITFPTVTGDELAKMLADKTPVIILDARSGKWDDGKRIPGAKQLTDKATPEEVGKLLPDKSAKIITYCSNVNCPASLRLAEYLKKLGYTNVVKYPGGLEDWLKSGREVVTEKK